MKTGQQGRGSRQEQGKSYERLRKSIQEVNNARCQLQLRSTATGGFVECDVTWSGKARRVLCMVERERERQAGWLTMWSTEEEITI